MRTIKTKLKSLSLFLGLVSLIIICSCSEDFLIKEPLGKAVHRFLDLRRWGIDNEVLNDFIARDSKFRTYMQGAVYDPEEDDYLPLPRYAVDLQKGVLTQDSSYINCKY